MIEPGGKPQFIPQNIEPSIPKREIVPLSATTRIGNVSIGDRSASEVLAERISNPSVAHLLNRTATVGMARDAIIEEIRLQTNVLTTGSDGWELARQAGGEQFGKVRNSVTTQGEQLESLLGILTNDAPQLIGFPPRYSKQNIKVVMANISEVIEKLAAWEPNDENISALRDRINGRLTTWIQKMHDTLPPEQREIVQLQSAERLVGFVYRLWEQRRHKGMNPYLTTGRRQESLTDSSSEELRKKMESYKDQFDEIERQNPGLFDELFDLMEVYQRYTKENSTDTQGVHRKRQALNEKMKRLQTAMKAKNIQLDPVIFYEF